MTTAESWTAGPWEHRFLTANGAQFHVAHAGEHSATRPLVILAHTYPETWWAWRHQISALADAGFEVAAPDARGADGSDKTPGRIDLVTLAADMPAVAESLGASSCVIVGAGLAGAVAWAAASIAPHMVKGVLTFGALHPAQFFRAAQPWNPQHLVNAARGLTYPRPRSLRAPEAMRTFLTRWSAAGNMGAANEAETYAAALSTPEAATTLSRQQRWAERCLTRPSGAPLRAIIAPPISQPVWAVRGIEDPTNPKANWRADKRRTSSRYRTMEVSGAGHYIAEEQPNDATAIIEEFLAALARR